MDAGDGRFHSEIHTVMYHVVGRFNIGSLALSVILKENCDRNVPDLNCQPHSSHQQRR